MVSPLPEQLEQSLAFMRRPTLGNRKSRARQGFPRNDRLGHKGLDIEQSKDNMAPTLVGGSAGRHFRRNPVPFHGLSSAKGVEPPPSFSQDFLIERRRFE